MTQNLLREEQTIRASLQQEVIWFMENEQNAYRQGTVSHRVIGEQINIARHNHDAMRREIESWHKCQHADCANSR